jgi:DNA-binding MarR family transcriptional regulator
LFLQNENYDYNVDYIVDKLALVYVARQCKTRWTYFLNKNKCYLDLMSQSIKVTESPKHFMVLDAISRGIGDNGKIAKVTKISKAEVEMILNDLAVQKLIILEQKKGLFGKKVQARITYTGSRLLSFKKQELEDKSRGLESMYINRDRRGIESFMDDNRAWIPMMIFSGIMNAMVFASMISFMGMAMNPAEAAMAGDAANADPQDTTDTQSATDLDNSSASDAGADVSSTQESSGFDIGGGDFGGDFEF